MENERTQGCIVFRCALSRLFCSYRYWIEVLSAAIICFISPYIMEMVSKAAETLSPEIVEEFRQGNVYNIGLLSIPSLVIKDYTCCDRIIAGVLSGSITQSLIMVIVTTYISSEFSGGYFIRALILGENRSFLLAKYASASLVGCLLPIIICPLFTGISLTVKYGMPVSDFSNLFLTLLTQILMMCGLVVCCVSASILLTGKGATILAIVCTMTSPLIPRYLQAILGRDLSIDDKILFCRLIKSSEMNPSIFDFIVTIITLAIIYSIGWLVTAVRSFK